MKRIILGLLSAVCLAGGLSAQDIVNLRQDAQSQGLRYQVASVDEDVLVRKDYFREDWPSRQWFRDDLRNCLREESGNVYTFDRSGNMISHTYTLRGTTLRTTTCAYSNGHLVSLVGEGCKVVANGKDLDIYAESSTYANPQLDSKKNDYAFDLKCRLEWADDGPVMATRYYYVDSMPAKAYEYSYNHRGQITEMVSLVYLPHSKTPQKVVTRYTYDNNDCLAKMVVRGESFDDTYIYENNQQGDPVKMTYTTPYATTIYDYEYKYDESGNWVMRLQFKDGAFENATLRTIRYHNGGDAQGVAQQELKAREAEQQRMAKEEAAAAKKDQPKAKADKPAKESKAKADKPAKEKKAKADKPAKESKAKADKPAKEKKAKPAKQEKAKPAKEKSKKNKKSDSNTPAELR